MSSPDDRIAIIGLGLIGSSIARGVRTRRPSTSLVGYDRDPAVLDQAERLRLVDRTAATLADAVLSASMVIMCVPVGALVDLAASVAPHLRSDAVLTDVGSSKAAVALQVRAACPDLAFIPAHPIAGSHLTGPAAGTPDLFQGRWCILTPDGNSPLDAVERVRSFWLSLGARVRLMSPEDHDQVLAAISHVPHLLAFASVLSVMNIEADTDAEIMALSGGGFRDFTRIAAADPVIWRDTLISNRHAVRAVLGRYRESLDQLESMLDPEQAIALAATLAEVRDKRLQLDLPLPEDA